MTKVAVVILVLGVSAMLLADQVAGQLMQISLPPRKLSQDATQKTPPEEGFGCPVDQSQCDGHCKGLGEGRTSGYCGGFLKTSCTCVS
ncbi:hypothetical protein RvY_00962 [Ramazzottius varieornatus]|uniref:Invertebrate defensins family profile domain-containing protein n=1 Tax=Ramazzottius varieornatus TaxID=947166 RepID=A0A1D1UKQ7_RAMVA|nr:hypothetical protein RvY_00962 [Ramazzottius varieornatus]